MLKRLWRWMFGERGQQESDPVLEFVMNEALRTGKVVNASVEQDGSLRIEYLDGGFDTMDGES